MSQNAENDAIEAAEATESAQPAQSAQSTEVAEVAEATDVAETTEAAEATGTAAEGGAPVPGARSPEAAGPASTAAEAAAVEVAGETVAATAAADAAVPPARSAAPAAEPAQQPTAPIPSQAAPIPVAPAPAPAAAPRTRGIGRGTKGALAVLLVYVVEAIILKATGKNAANADASIVIGAFTTLFGAGIIALALPADYLAALRLRWRLRGSAVTAPAVVAARVSFHGTDFSYPVFEYPTPDGAVHRHADAAARSFKVGAQTRVRYAPADADRAVGPLGGFHALVFGLIALLGAVFAVIMPILTVQSIAG